MEQYNHELKVDIDDSLKYVDQVRLEFSDNLNIYYRFLIILDDFSKKRIGTRGVIDSVKKLFRGHPKLILGMNKFLPDGEEFKIVLTAEEEIESITEPNNGFTRQQLQLRATSFVEMVRIRFIHQPQIFGIFLRVLLSLCISSKKYIDKPYEQSFVLNELTKDEHLQLSVVQQVCYLLADHADLLEEFLFFLRDSLKVKTENYCSVFTKIAAKRKRQEAATAPAELPIQSKQQQQQQQQVVRKSPRLAKRCNATKKISKW